MGSFRNMAMFFEESIFMLFKFPKYWKGLIFSFSFRFVNIMSRLINYSGQGQVALLFVGK